MESLERVVDPHRQRIKDLEAQVSRLHEELNRLQDLRENAERYLTIVEDIEDGYFEVDVAGNFTFFNDSMCRLLGHAPDQMMGMNYRQYMDEETSARIFRSFNQVYTTGESSKVLDWVLIRKDGTRRDIEASVSLKRDSEGEPIGFRGVARDVTERLQAERELEERGKYLERVLDAVPDAIITLDPNNRVVEWNPGAGRLFGYSREEAVGQDLDDLVAISITQQEAAALTQTVMKGAELSPVETVRHQKDGSPLHVIVAGAPILVGDTMTGAVAIYTDISERVQAELQRVAMLAALQTAHAELETRVKERTAELSALLSEKEILLQEIHHRVKNNLQIISSLLSLQSGLVDDQQALEVFQDSRHRVRSMALIHEKLYRSQNLARIDFADYIRDLTRYLFASYVKVDQDVNLNVQADDVYLGIDTAVPCGLILNELVSNALKHAFPSQADGSDGRETPPTGEIRVELRRQEANTLTMLVADNGVGLPRDLDIRYTTSLGLQLVTTLVNQLDGTLELDDRDGTLFRITFPTPHDLS